MVTSSLDTLKKPSKRKEMRINKKKLGMLQQT